MQTEEDLKGYFKEIGLLCYKVHIDIDVAESIELDVSEIENFVKFVKDHNINTVFYEYDYIDEDSLSINEDTYSKFRFDEEMIELLQHDFDKHNDIVSKLDFSNPVSLYIYCIYNGIIFYFIEYDYWFKEQGIEIPQIYVMQLATKYFDEYVERRKNIKDNAMKLREQIRNQILNDPNFHKCTNSHLRIAYASRIFKENSEYQKAFIHKASGLYDITIKTFIEEIWKDYKIQKTLK